MAASISGFSRSGLLKTTAFAVVVTLLTVLVMGTCGIFIEGYALETIMAPSFIESREFAQITGSLIDIGIGKLYDNSGYRYSSLPDSSQYILYVTNGEREYISNGYKERSDFERYGPYFIEHQGNANYLYEKGNQIEINTFYHHYNFQDESITAYLSYKDSYIAQQEDNWRSTRALLGQYLYRSVAMLAILLLLVIYLMVAAGRRPQDDQLHLMGIDRIFTDLPIAALLMILSGWGLLFVFVIDERLISDPVIYQVMALITALSAAGCLFLWLLLVKKIKARRFWRDTICVHLLTWMTAPIKAAVGAAAFGGIPFKR